VVKQSGLKPCAYRGRDLSCGIVSTAKTGSHGKQSRTVLGGIRLILSQLAPIGPAADPQVADSHLIHQKRCHKLLALLYQH